MTYRYQILIDIPGHGWLPAFSFASERERDRVLRERAAAYPKTTYRAHDRT